MICPKCLAYMLAVEMLLEPDGDVCPLCGHLEANESLQIIEYMEQSGQTIEPEPLAAILNLPPQQFA